MSSLQNGFDDHKPSVFGNLDFETQFAKASVNDFQNYSQSSNYPASFPLLYGTCVL